MKTPAVLLRYVLSLLMTFSVIPAVGQGSGGKLPDAPTAKTQSPAPSQNQSSSPFKDQKEKLSYAYGMYMGRNLRQLGEDVNAEIVAQGIKDGLAGGKTLMTEEEARGLLMQAQSEAQAKEAARQKQLAETNLKEGEAFLAANKSKEGVVTLPSGLQYKVLTQGTGPKPTAADTVVCNYRGTLINDAEFDSSAKHGGPATFPVNGVIKGWTEALQLMPVGSKWQLFIPSSMAYGEREVGRGQIPPNSTLIFEVELLSIKPKENPPAATTPPK